MNNFIRLLDVEEKNTVLSLSQKCFNKLARQKIVIEAATWNHKPSYTVTIASKLANDLNCHRYHWSKLTCNTKEHEVHEYLFRQHYKSLHFAETVFKFAQDTFFSKSNCLCWSRWAFLIFTFFLAFRCGHTASHTLSFYPHSLLIPG